MSETKTKPAPEAGAVQKAGGPPGQKMVTELKVSGHLMSLDAGLFCIFNQPGSTPQDPNTGLPGVRVSQPPGPAFHPDAITITSFRDDGYLGGMNGAALVRVTRGPAQLLVTIYQAPNSTSDAPRLQIIRLTDTPPLQAAQPAQPAIAAPAAKPADAPAAPATQAKPAAPVTAADAEIVAHVQTRGDVVARLDGWMGIPASTHWIEGFAISPKTLIGPADIEYQAVLGRGWLSPWADGGQYCGSRGMSLPILGLRVRLRGEAADGFDCAVTATFVDGTKVGPLDNGEPAQAESLSPLEAFKIDITPRAAAEAKPAAARKTKAKPVEPVPPPAFGAKAKAPVKSKPAAPKKR